MSNKKLVIYIISYLLFSCVYAQSNKQLETPLWIKMYQDPKTNYYKTIEVFREFWEYRTLPKEPFQGDEKEEFEEEVGLDDEEITEDQKKNFKLKDPFKNYNFANDVKAFKGWLQDAHQWLKEDGTIYTLVERQKIIDQQQKDLKETEKQNLKH